MNFLTETTAAIQESGYSPANIVFIGSVETGHRCSWDEFCAMADFEYDSGFGAQRIASDLIIVFADGCSMWRGEHDGSEWWEFAKPFVEPVITKPIKTLVVSPEQVGWKSLADLNS